jgi:hypothetical protein
VVDVPLEAAMSSARITIGGMDVSPHPGEPGAGALPATPSQSIAGINRTYDGKHAPVILTLESAPRPRCPLPPGPWRIISALAVLGLIFSLVAILSRRRQCCAE